MDADLLNAFTDKYNIVVGTVVAILSYIFGKNWYLFAGYLLLNVLDWITGWMKSRLAGVENSQKGLTGIIKKVGYWIMILLAFLMGTLFIKMGDLIGIDLQVTTLLGWFVLASLTINEIRSILENFVEAGYHPPKVLTKGLSVAYKLIDEVTETEEEEE